MKRTFLFTLFCSLYLFCKAQVIHVSADQTTSLIFPFAISYVDRGSKDLLVQSVKESDHVLFIKAAVKNFNPTNLSVVMADGSIYALAVQYNALPDMMVYQLPALKTASIETYANGILDNPPTVTGIQDHRWNMAGNVTGIYIKDQIIYYQIRITNKSAIDYDVDFMRFYIRDKRKGKRTASQENELKPLFIAGNTSVVKGGGKNVIVVALEKFTIPDAKFLAIEINEKNGGRHLFMKIKNNKIIRAIQLPDLK
ncbi:MAG: conjugative transposon protein TraN [Ferruginibacter sp.]